MPVQIRDPDMYDIGFQDDIAGTDKCISNLNTEMSTLGDPRQKWFIIQSSAHEYAHKFCFSCLCFFPFFLGEGKKNEWTLSVFSGQNDTAKVSADWIA